MLGTESGASLRLRGKGLPDPRIGSRGDQIIRVKLRMPRRLTPGAPTGSGKAYGTRASRKQPRRKRRQSQTKRSI